MKETAAESAASETRWRLRLVSCVLVLVALAIVQKPGFLVPDTKLDLAVDPAGFLERSLHMWDPQAAFGQVQNQAYGYFLPMGSWFLLGSALDLPGWLVQRLWLALVMVVAFLGVVRLAGALGIGGPLSRVVAGFAYALSPRMISTLGPISIEAWPSAMAPWVLLPLVLGSRGGSVRRAAAFSGLAVALTGGVNAAASSAVLAMGVLWLLTRPPGPRRRGLLLWWPFLTLLGTLWWLVPLFLLGRFSPPFLDFIESASVTSLPTTLFDGLRGTSAWVPYIEPGWRAGNDLITTGFLILNSGVVMLLGVVGLTRPDLPHRRFLVLVLTAGMILVTASHLGAVHGWFAVSIQGLLDGPLAALRNVHKFDPVIRLPMVLGLAHLLGQLRLEASERQVPERTWRQRPAAVLYAGVLSLSLVAVAGAAGPAWTGRLTPRGEFVALPGYWEETAHWLAEQDASTRALLLPGSAFGSYIWGNPRDEPLQVMARSPWAVRDAIPLAPAGTIRMLDAIEARMADGRGSKGLAPYLRRAGISHLVVRNDLKRSDDIPDPLLVHQALAQSPGISRVAVFGPEVGGQTRIGSRRDDRVLVNYGWQSTFPAVEIFAVQRAEPVVRTDESLPVVVGGPESLLDLADHDVLPNAPAVLAVHAPREIGAAPLIVTDGLRRRESTFGRVHDSRSHTLSPGEERRPRAPAREYELTDSPRWETRAELVGAQSISASSSVGDVTAPGAIRQEWMPWSAFDGDERTEWVSVPRRERPWIEMELSSARALPLVLVTGGEALGDATQQVSAVTDRGESDVYEVAAGQTVTVRLPPGSTRRLRIEGREGARLALADIHLPGIDVARPLRVPAPRRGWPSPDLVLVSASEGARTGCVTVESDVRCAPGREQAPEEPFGLDRLLRLYKAGNYGTEVTAAPIGGPELEALIQTDLPVNVHGSSAAVDAAASSGIAAVDGDLGTTWVADEVDGSPTLSISWLGRARISGITVALDLDAAATPPSRVTVAYPGGEQTVELDEQGYAELRPIRTDQLELTMTADSRAATLQFDDTARSLGIGLSELRLEGLELLPMTLGVTERRYECGTGPALSLNGVTSQTRLVASPRDLYRGRDVLAEVCGAGEVLLQEGDNRMRLIGSDFAAGRALLLRREGARQQTPEPTLAAHLESDSPTSRLITGGSTGGGSTLALRENTNAGWVAAVEDSRPVTADGWQQAWSLGSTADPRIGLRFAPDVPYRIGLGAGAVTFALLLLFCLWPSRRHKVTPPPVERDAIPVVLMAPTALLVSGVLAGWVGVAVAATAFALSRICSRSVTDEVRAWIAGGPVAAAAVIYASRPLGSPDGWAGSTALPQCLVLASLVWVLVAESRLGGLMPRNLMTGISTRR